MGAGGRTPRPWRTASGCTRAGARSPPGWPPRRPACARASGSSPGDRVAIVMRNRPEYLEALFAIWHAGLVAVPVNARLHRDEIAYILDHSGSAVVVTDDEHAEDVEPLVGTVDTLRAAVLAPGPRWDRLTAAGAGAARRPAAGRRGLAVLHQRHHRAAQGSDAHAPQPADGVAELLRRHRPGDAAGLHPARRAAVARLGAVRPAPRGPGRGERRSRTPAASTATRSPPCWAAGRACRCSPRRRWSSGWPATPPSPAPTCPT